LSLSIKVTPTENGAVITVNGYDISISVTPSEAVERVTPQTMEPMLGKVRSSLSEHLDELTITETDDEIIVKPTGYLGREKFASVAGVIRELGGSYISAGKDSRFVVPKD